MADDSENVPAAGDTDNDAQAKAEAATKIQAIQRGKQAREDIEKKQEAAVKIQAIQRGKAEREEIQQRQEAAVRIQAAQRGKQARQQVQAELDAQQEGGGDTSASETKTAAPAATPAPKAKAPPAATSAAADDAGLTSDVSHGAYVASHRERTDEHNASGRSRIKQRHLQAPSTELHKKSCLRRLQLPNNIPSTPVIVLIGDLASLEDEQSNKMLNFYRNGIMRAAAAIDALVIDSGLASGIAAASPRKEYAEHCRNLCQLGISPSNIEDSLSKYHTHQLVISDYNGWSDRQAEFIKHKFGMVRRLAGSCRTVCVLINNGHTAWGETIEAVRLGIPVIILQGSGDLANEIIYAKMTGQCYDFNIREVVNSGCVVIFNSDCNEADLASLLRLHATIDILGIQKGLSEKARRGR